MTLTSATALRAIMPSSVDFPPPAAAKIPTRCPRPVVRTRRWRGRRRISVRYAFAFYGIGRGLDDGIDFGAFKGPFVWTSRGSPRPLRMRPRSCGPTLIWRGRWVGMTSEEGPIPVISPRGERNTSSRVKPTTSVRRGSPSRLTKQTSPILTWEQWL